MSWVHFNARSNMTCCQAHCFLKFHWEADLPHFCNEVIVRVQHWCSNLGSDPATALLPCRSCILGHQLMHWRFMVISAHIIIVLIRMHWNIAICCLQVKLCQLRPFSTSIIQAPTWFIVRYGEEMTDPIYFPGSLMELLQKADLSFWPAFPIRWTKTSTCLIFPYGCNSLHHSDASLLISCFFWQQHTYSSASQTPNRTLPWHLKKCVVKVTIWVTWHSFFPCLYIVRWGYPCPSFLVDLSVHWCAGCQFEQPCGVLTFAFLDIQANLGKDKKIQAIHLLLMSTPFCMA